jgi:hypothetical protein
MSAFDIDYVQFRGELPFEEIDMNLFRNQVCFPLCLEAISSAGVFLE